MSVFRINLKHSFDYVIGRGALSAPSENLLQHKKENDNTGYRELEKIKAGDTLLLCRGIRDIHAIAYTATGCVIADLDAYSDEPEYFPRGYRLIELKVMKFRWNAENGHDYFDGTLTGTPFKTGAMGFCLQLHPDPKKAEEFYQKMNDLLKK